jgi:hypothetical protein
MQGTLKLALFIILLILPVHKVLSQEVSNPAYRFIFYNVENLFDTVDDSLTDDNEFLPDGPMHWTEARYRHKINSVYKVLAAAGEWNPPALAGFCEVENKAVLMSLVFDTWLSKYKYGIVTGESKDPRGIRTGIIYRKDLMKLISSRNIEPFHQSSDEFRSRDILYTTWLLGDDTIHLFLNHWPSRRRGVLAEEKLRQSVSTVLGQAVDSLFRSSGRHVRIIVAGDFNCTPDDVGIISLCKGRGVEERSQVLINLSADAAEKGEGTFKYRGKWEMLDQVLVSPGMVNPANGIHTGKKFFRIFRPDFLLHKDTGYPGPITFSTYRGFSYLGGFSDHLPVILDLMNR